MSPARRTRSKAPRPDAATSSPNPPWLRLAAFLAATFVMKLIIMTQLQSQPLLQPDAGLDTTAYVQLARRVIGGDLALGPGLYYVSPLYLYFLAAVLAASDSLTFVRVAQILLGTAAVGFVFMSARAWFGERAAWIAAVLASLTGVFTFFEIVIMQSALDTFLTAAAVGCLAQSLSGTPPTRFGARWTLAAGVLFGLQTLNRPNVAIAAIAVTLIMLAAGRRRGAIALAAGLACGVAPVVARNAIVSGQFAVASSQGGLNFYIGNRAEATGQYGEVPGVRANIEGQAEDTRRIAEKALGRPLTDTEVSSYFAQLGSAWIRSNPGAAAALFVRKLALVFNARHQWLDLSYPYYAFDAGSWLWALFVGPWLLVPLGVAGLAMRPNGERTGFLIWAAFVPAYAVSVAVFFVAERYRLPLFVPLTVSAGAAIDRALGIVAPQLGSKGRS